MIEAAKCAGEMKWMDPKNPPARATVEAKLAEPRMLVEIACIAAK